MSTSVDANSKEGVLNQFFKRSEFTFDDRWKGQKLTQFYSKLYQLSNDLIMNGEVSLIEEDPENVPAVGRWYFVKEEYYKKKEDLIKVLRIKKPELNTVVQPPGHFEYKQGSFRFYLVRIVKLKSRGAKDLYNFGLLDNHYLVHSFKAMKGEQGNESDEDEKNSELSLAQCSNLNNQFKQKDQQALESQDDKHKSDQKQQSESNILFDDTHSSIDNKLDLGSQPVIIQEQQCNLANISNSNQQQQQEYEKQQQLQKQQIEELSECVDSYKKRMEEAIKLISDQNNQLAQYKNEFKLINSYKITVDENEKIEILKLKMKIKKIKKLRKKDKLNHEKKISQMLSFEERRKQLRKKLQICQIVQIKQIKQALFNLQNNSIPNNNNLHNLNSAYRRIKEEEAINISTNSSNHSDPQKKQNIDEIVDIEIQEFKPNQEPSEKNSDDVIFQYSIKIKREELEGEEEGNHQISTFIQNKFEQRKIKEEIQEQLLKESQLSQEQHNGQLIHSKDSQFHHAASDFQNHVTELLLIQNQLNSLTDNNELTQMIIEEPQQSIVNSQAINESQNVLSLQQQQQSQSYQQQIQQSSQIQEYQQEQSQLLSLQVSQPQSLLQEEILSEQAGNQQQQEQQLLSQDQQELQKEQQLSQQEQQLLSQDQQEIQKEQQLSQQEQQQYEKEQQQLSQQEQQEFSQKEQQLSQQEQQQQQQYEQEQQQQQQQEKQQQLQQEQQQEQQQQQQQQQLQQEYQQQEQQLQEEQQLVFKEKQQISQQENYQSEQMQCENDQQEQLQSVMQLENDQQEQLKSVIQLENDQQEQFQTQKQYDQSKVDHLEIKENVLQYQEQEKNTQEQQIKEKQSQLQDQEQPHIIEVVGDKYVDGQDQSPRESPSQEKWTRQHKITSEGDLKKILNNYYQQIQNNYSPTLINQSQPSLQQTIGINQIGTSPLLPSILNNPHIQLPTLPIILSEESYLEALNPTHEEQAKELESNENQKDSQKQEDTNQKDNLREFNDQPPNDDGLSKQSPNKSEIRSQSSPEILDSKKNEKMI